jgi:hypothetical protein
MTRDLEQENRVLREKVRTLQRENRHLRRLGEEQVDSLVALLRRRGLQVYRMNPTDELLLPPSAPAALQQEYYERLHRYSFRLFLRDLIKHQEEIGLSQLTRYCSAEVAAGYLRFLCEAGAAEATAYAHYRVVRTVRSFGGTLEWYVHRMLREEFAAPALYGVRFKGSGQTGDFDVLADFEGSLLYLEVKSSPPRGIEAHQVGAFLERAAGLIPRAAIFFNDTELRMKDKLVPLFEEALRQRVGPRETAPSAERLCGEIFRFGPDLYLMNSRKRVSENLGICLRQILIRG